MFPKKNSLFIVLVFLAAISLPFIFSNKHGGKIAVVENRYLATFPKLFTEAWKPAPGIHNGLENWIKDNAGGRNEAFELNYFLNYKLFNVIPEPEVVGGKNQWLYLLPTYDLPNYLETNIPSPDHLDWLKENLSRVTEKLRTKNIEFLTMVWQNKYSIYPENMPDSLVPVNNISAIEILDKELSNNPDFDFSTPLEILKTGKENRLVYYKAYDRSHWNHYGAFLAYTALMKQAQHHLPELRVLTEEDFIITPEIKVTDSFWGFYTEEEDLKYSLNGGYKAYSDKTFFDTFQYDSKDIWKSNNYYINSDSSLPKAVIIGDSFIWMFMLPNLAESFSEMVFINYLDIEYLNLIIDKLGPDIVISASLGPGSVNQIAAYHYSPAQYMDAEIISSNTPTQIIRGSMYDIDITVKNVGPLSWRDEVGIQLCIFVDGQDYDFRISLPTDVEVNNGEEYTFSLNEFQALPKESFFVEYQMVQDRNSFFGEKQRVDIIVKQP